MHGSQTLLKCRPSQISSPYNVLLILSVLPFSRYMYMCRPGGPVLVRKQAWTLLDGPARPRKSWQPRPLSGAKGKRLDRRFFAAWDAVRFLPGESWLHAAWTRVKQGNLCQQIKRLHECISLKFAAFLALAAELQKLRRGEPILLPCRNVAEVLGTNKETVSNHRQLATKQGLLQVERMHEFKSRDATEFYFDLARLDKLLASGGLRCGH